MRGQGKIFASLILPLLATLSCGPPSLEKLRSGPALAFTSREPGALDTQIYLISPTGGKPRPITRGKGQHTWPAWSPDGAWLAFDSDEDHGNSDIYVVRADGKKLTRLTRHMDIDRFPDWSPDGKQIAFSSKRDGNFEIYVMNRDGSNPRRLTQNSSHDLDPQFSPDGSRIAFVSKRTGVNQLYTMASDGSDQRAVKLEIAGLPLLGHPPEPDDEAMKFQFSDNAPCWSPDGKALVFCSARKGPSKGSRHIWTINADGSGEHKLTEGDFEAGYPYFSGDGKQIVYASSQHLGMKGDWEIFIMNADGSNPQRLTWNPDVDDHPAWRW